MSEIQPYSEIRKIGEDIWVVDGEWYDSPLARRMTVMRLPSGELVAHNPFRMHEKDYALLDKLGKVTYVIGPNKIHCSDIHYFVERYPQAQVFAPADAVKGAGVKLFGILPDGWPVALKNEISCLAIKGTRFFTEIVFFHKRSKTLIVTDTIFNMQNDPKGFQKAIFKFNWIYKRFGPSKLTRHVFTKDWKAVQNSFREVLLWDFDQVVVNHGEVLKSGGQEAVKKGFEL